MTPAELTLRYGRWNRWRALLLGGAFNIEWTNVEKRVVYLAVYVRTFDLYQGTHGTYGIRCYRRVGVTGT